MTKDPAAVALGRKGGLIGGTATTEAKAAAARENGLKGGRPRKTKAGKTTRDVKR
jgi:hypothetical protein